MSRGIVLLQLQRRNLLLVILEAWSCYFLRCHTIGFPKMLSLFGVSSSRSLLLKVLDLHDHELLDFDCSDHTHHIPWRKCTTDGVPKYYE